MHEAKYDRGVNEFKNLIQTHLVSIYLRAARLGFSCIWGGGTVRSSRFYIRKLNYYGYSHNWHQFYKSKGDAVFQDKKNDSVVIDERIKGKCIILHIKYIMRNSNNKRTEEQELKTIAKSAYSITNRSQLCLYQSKMQTIKRNQSKRKASIRMNDQSTILERKSTSKKKVNTTESLKQKFDHFIHEMFVQIDFDCSGFITATKISYYKHLPEEVFYFFGGIFQKIKQMGAVTEKMFMSLSDEAFVHARVEDIEELLKHDLKERKQKKKSHQHQKTFLRKKQNVQLKLHSLSCSQFKSIKFMKKLDIHERSGNEPLLERKVSNSTISKRECLKKQLDCFTKRQCLSTDKQSRPFAIDTQRKKEESNFNSLKVKQLSERLDRQIAHSQIRINLGKSIR